MPASVLDLDDTVYLERDYVRSGFHAVAGRSSPQVPRPGPTASWVFERLSARFRGRRAGGPAFDGLLAANPRRSPHSSRWHRSWLPTGSMPRGSTSSTAWQRCWRRFAPRAPPAGRDHRRTPLPSQWAKLARAGRAPAASTTVVVTDDWGREWWKPHSGFETVAERLGLRPHRPRVCRRQHQTRTSSRGRGARLVGRPAASARAAAPSRRPAGGLRRRRGALVDALRALLLADRT